MLTHNGVGAIYYSASAPHVKLVPARPIARFPARPEPLPERSSRDCRSGCIQASRHAKPCVSSRLMETPKSARARLTASARRRKDISLMVRETMLVTSIDELGTSSQTNLRREVVVITSNHSLIRPSFGPGPWFNLCHVSHMSLI